MSPRHFKGKRSESISKEAEQPLTRNSISFNTFQNEPSRQLAVTKS